MEFYEQADHIYWFPMRECYFSRDQMPFLLRNLNNLWPSNPAGEARTMVTNAHHSSNAYFTKPMEIRAEITKRLKLCNRDGMIAEACYTWEKDVDEVSMGFHVSREYVERAVPAVVGYISGWRPKTEPYRLYRARQHYRRWSGVA